MLGCGVSLGGDVGLTCCSLGCNPVLEASSDPSVGVHVVLRGCGIMSGSGRGCPVLLSVVISLACTAGCVSATAPPTSPIGSGSPSSPAQVTVARDLPFAGSAPSLTEWSPPTLDVYTAGEDGGRLLVVILPPHGLTKEQAGAESQLAEALAEREAVAVVANWTQLDEPDASFTDIDVLAKLAKAGQSMAACAVAFAVEHAEDYGADPTRLVIVGEIYGANAAAVVALTHPAPLTSCKADAVPQAIAVVALDADWYAAMPEWDQLGKDVHQAVDLLAPWSGLNAVSNVRVAATVATGTHDITNRCGGPEAPWLVDRDPTGQLRKRLDTVGALTDGCIDLLDQAQAATNQLAAAGLTARVIQLANTDSKTGLDPGGHITTFGDADLQALMQVIADEAAA